MKTIFKINCKKNFEFLVVAHNANEAYAKVKKYLDTENLGFRSDRELRSIEVLANKIADDDYDVIYEELF